MVVARVVMVVCEVMVVRAAMVVPGSEDHGSNGVTSASVCVMAVRSSGSSTCASGSKW